MEKNTVEKLVETREAKMWKSLVSAITRLVHSPSGRLRLVALA